MTNKTVHNFEHIVHTQNDVVEEIHSITESTKAFQKYASIIKDNMYATSVENEVIIAILRKSRLLLMQ